jgi:transcriptional regulator GlxA family with amidase domain
MTRGQILSAAGAASLVAARRPRIAQARTGAPWGGMANAGKPVKPPAHRPVQIAFVVGGDTVLIDVAGPWETFNDAMTSFNTYLVAPSMHEVSLGGLRVRPDYTYDTAPKPNVLVVPGTHGTPETIAWIKHANTTADITMSVCVGAFLVAKAGLFDGKYVTTHHDAYDEFARRFPKAKLVRGPRYVEDWDVSSSGGETSGIDLALRVVERYFGKRTEATAAATLEHVSTRRIWS